LAAPAAPQQDPKPSWFRRAVGAITGKPPTAAGSPGPSGHPLASPPPLIDQRIDRIMGELARGSTIRDREAVLTLLRTAHAGADRDEARVFALAAAIKDSPQISGLPDDQELLALLRQHADDAEGGIRGAVVHHLEWVEAHPDETRTLFEHRQTLERTPRAAELRDQNRPVLAEVRAWLARHVEAGTIRDLGAVSGAVWYGPAQAVARDWIGGRLRGAPSAVAEELAEAAWRSFRAS